MVWLCGVCRPLHPASNLGERGKKLLPAFSLRERNPFFSHRAFVMSQAAADAALADKIAGPKLLVPFESLARWNGNHF